MSFICGLGGSFCYMFCIRTNTRLECVVILLNCMFQKFCRIYEARIASEAAVLLFFYCRAHLKVPY